MSNQQSTITRADLAKNPLQRQLCTEAKTIEKSHSGNTQPMPNIPKDSIHPGTSDHGPQSTTHASIQNLQQASSNTAKMQVSNPNSRVGDEIYDREPLLQEPTPHGASIEHMGLLNLYLK